MLHTTNVIQQIHDVPTYYIIILHNIYYNTIKLCNIIILHNLNVKLGFKQEVQIAKAKHGYGEINNRGQAKIASRWLLSQQTKTKQSKRSEC